MNTIITILLVFAAIIAVCLIIALFTRREYEVEREVIINKPIHDVFSFIRYLKNQDHFSKWVMMDPMMKKDFRGTDGSVGFVYAWDGNKKAGKGEQEIVNITDGKRVDVEVRFVKPFEGVAQTPFVTEALANDQTRLKWGMATRLKYPMNIMLLFMNMDKVLGKDIQSSLATLKAILENEN
jgi:uncharacterized protein YndB with AHSA1/START domain